MDRIALQILEDGWEQDGRAMRRAIATLRDRLAESTDGRWAAAAFEINRIYNILEKAFERLCESFENHLEKTGKYHDTLIERATLDLKGIRPAIRSETSVNSRVSGISFDMPMISTSIPSASRPPPTTPPAALRASTAGAVRFWRKSAAATATNSRSGEGIARSMARQQRSVSWRTALELRDQSFRPSGDRFPKTPAPGSVVVFVRRRRPRPSP